MPPTGATATAAASAASDLSPANLSCTKCLATFTSREAKRRHMQEDWHVYNLKRHIASLPPITVTVFRENVVGSDCEQEDTNRKGWQAHLQSGDQAQKTAETESDDSFSSNESPLRVSSFDAHEEDQSANQEESFSPFQCLFCNVESASMDSNLTHMSHAHGFFIPDVENLIDTESLLSYLFAVVFVFHECLSCGCSKTTKFGVQDHMRRKGHCRVDFEDDEHDLQQFYDFSGDDDDEGNQPKTEATLFPSEDELHLPSGKVLGRRSRRARHFRPNLSTNPSSPSPSPHQHHLTNSIAETSADNELETLPIASPGRTLAMRAGTSTSLIGVPELHRRALLALENKTEMTATRRKNEFQHVVEKGGNKQKRYRVVSIGKKQGGLEKRLG